MTVEKATRAAISSMIDSERRTQALYDVIFVQLKREGLTEDEEHAAEQEITRVIKIIQSQT